jgi:hypothetical protein
LAFVYRAEQLPLAGHLVKKLMAAVKKNSLHARAARLPADVPSIEQKPEPRLAQAASCSPGSTARGGTLSAPRPRPFVAIIKDLPLSRKAAIRRLHK